MDFITESDTSSTKITLARNDGNVDIKVNGIIVATFDGEENQLRLCEIFEEDEEALGDLQLNKSSDETRVTYLNVGTDNDGDLVVEGE